MKQPVPLAYRRVLTVAGSDSSGGAGIQADLKSFAALGCYGMTVITAVTAQNTRGVKGIHPVPATVVEQQMEAILDDIGADAVKIGMLFSSEVIAVVARTLQRYGAKNVVIDPVMAAQSGDPLMREDAMSAMKALLLPQCLLLTPNLPEAEKLLNRPIPTIDAMQAAAVDLAAMGPVNILIKGGHSLNNPATDILYLSKRKELSVLSGDLISTKNNHGTGCTLSAAVAANLAHGLDVKEAVREAKNYISNALAAGAAYQLGRGQGPVHHFFNFWR